MLDTPMCLTFAINILVAMGTVTLRIPQLLRVACNKFAYRSVRVKGGDLLHNIRCNMLHNMLHRMLRRVKAPLLKSSFQKTTPIVEEPTTILQEPTPILQEPTTICQKTTTPN